jgi:hypothetical protein
LVRDQFVRDISAHPDKVVILIDEVMVLLFEAARRSLSR